MICSLGSFEITSRGVTAPAPARTHPSLPSASFRASCDMAWQNELIPIADIFEGSVIL